jgi:4-hydroxy-4-methyl-2-oxoglutarate aldolase
MSEITNRQIKEAFWNLSTAMIADAIVHLGIEPRFAEPGIRPLTPGARIAGRALTVRHFGSVDIYFEAMSSAQPGDIMVIDNQGKMDEGCIGDLTALEARAHGIAGMVVWGAHRDTRELINLGFPVFSYGKFPFGPMRVDEREIGALVSAQFGVVKVEVGDYVFADDDGVLFVSGHSIERLFQVAHEIKQTERLQAEAIQHGETLHQQLRFDEYLVRRRSNPSYTFRRHLKDIGGAMEV